MLKYLKNVVTLQLDVKACNGCSMCVTVCPSAVFDIRDRQAIITDRDACIECGACAINCPTSAIRVQTGAGCAAGVLLSAIGIDSCCSSGSCCAPPAVAKLNQTGLCDSKIANNGIDSNNSPELSTNSIQKERKMTTNFIIYESAMCCSSGVCGPNPDQSLIRLQDTLEKIKTMGATVERYGITQNPKKFRENPEVLKLIQQQQIKALPITTVNGKVIRIGSYPDLDEFKKYLQDNKAELPATLEKRKGDDACCSGEELNNDTGCCAGQDSCDIRCSPNYIGSIKSSNKGKCC